MYLNVRKMQSPQEAVGRCKGCWVEIKIDTYLSHHHHHSGCFSLSKEEPLSTCLPQLPVSRNVTPGRSNILD